mmetsp:Transcript_137460/g.334073  ORF Transcript_137460/g.334073 Transcript_137460/m.334073 type:complete len:266 (-) Transcript_137460:1324-2121(-)
MAIRAVRGRVLRLHGGRLGWLHLRPEHDRSARADAGGPRPFQLWRAPGLHPLLRRRHSLGHPDPSCGLAAAAVPGAAGSAGRVLGLPGSGVLRHPAAGTCGNQEELHHCAVCPLPDPGHRWPAGLRRGHSLRPLPYGVLRPAVGAHPWPLREAHQDRQSPRRLRSGAPAGEPRGVRELPESAPGLRDAGRHGQPSESQQRLLLHGVVRLHRAALLREDVAPGLDLRPHLCHGLRDLVRLPPRLHSGALPAAARQEAWLRRSRNRA